MRWTLTIKDQTYGTGTEIPKYACRVTRAGGIVRLTVENQGTGAVRGGRFLMPRRWQNCSAMPATPPRRRFSRPRATAVAIMSVGARNSFGK